MAEEIPRDLPRTEKTARGQESWARLITKVTFPRCFPGATVNPSERIYVHRNQHRKIPLRAVRKIREWLRVRKILLPLPDLTRRRPPLSGRPHVLWTVPQGLRLQDVEL